MPVGVVARVLVATALALFLSNTAEGCCRKGKSSVPNQLESKVCKRTLKAFLKKPTAVVWILFVHQYDL